jgi:hypothetical protein
VTTACVVLAAVAVLLDGFAPLPRAFASNLHWIDFAAIACLGFGVDWKALRIGADEGTPIDGLLLGALAIAAVQAWAGAGRDGSAGWLAQLVAGSGVYFGLTRALRRAPAAIELVWRALAALAVVLGLHAVWAITGGVAGLVRQEDLVDAAWAGRHTLVKVLAFLTLALAGRAFEHRSEPHWRVVMLLGAIGTGLHLAGGGVGLGARALARLDDPVFFSTLSLTLLLAVGIAREAWALGKARPNEAARWRALAVATGVIAVGGALGEASGGEGVRMVVALGAIAVMSMRALPAVLTVPVPVKDEAEAEAEEEQPVQARAA